MIKILENEKEINEIMTIWKETNIKAHDFIDQKYWLKNYNLVKEEYIPIAKTYIYIEKDYIKGFISIIEDSFIGGLFVSIDEQGKGIGKKLINHAKSNHKKLKLAVYKKNNRAVKFYEKMGFVIELEQLNTDTKEAEYIMSL